MDAHTFLEWYRRVQKRFVTAAAIFLIGGFLIAHPNPVTHKCVPNFRTVMGLSSDGYPYQKHFCQDGYYPMLRWGEALLDNTTAEMFFILFPALLVLPVIFILTQKKR